MMLIYRKALRKTSLDTLKKEIWLNFWQWLHNGPKEIGAGGAVLIAPARENKAENHLPDLCEAGVQTQDVQHDYIYCLAHKMTQAWRTESWNGQIFT